MTKENPTGWRLERIYKWGVIISTAAETITISDLIVLLSIIKYGQDHPEQTRESEVIKGKKYVVQICMSKTEIYDAVGNHDWRLVFGDPGNKDNGVAPCFGSIMRLKTWVVQFWTNGDKDPLSQQYLTDYDLETSTYAVAKEFFDICTSGENIDLELLQRINAPNAQALYLYLRVNRTNRSPKLETIILALGLSTDTRSHRYDAKMGVIGAFERLQKLNIVRTARTGGIFDKNRKQFYWETAWNFYGGRISEPVPEAGYESAVSDADSVPSDAAVGK